MILSIQHKFHSISTNWVVSIVFKCWICLSQQQTWSIIILVVFRSLMNSTRWLSEQIFRSTSIHLISRSYKYKLACTNIIYCIILLQLPKFQTQSDFRYHELLYSSLNSASEVHIVNLMIFELRASVIYDRLWITLTHSILVYTESRI